MGKTAFHTLQYVPYVGHRMKELARMKRMRRRWKRWERSGMEKMPVGGPGREMEKKANWGNENEGKWNWLE